MPIFKKWIFSLIQYIMNTATLMVRDPDLLHSVLFDGGSGNWALDTEVCQFSLRKWFATHVLTMFLHSIFYMFNCHKPAVWNNKASAEKP